MFKMLKWAWHSAARAHSRSHSPQVKTPSLLLAKNATHVATRQRGVCVMCVYCFICVAHKFVYSTFSMAAQSSAYTQVALCALFLHCFVLKFSLYFFPAHFPIELSLFQAFVLHGTVQGNIYAILKREQQQAICGYLNCSHADIPSIYCISHNNSILFIFQFCFSQKTVAPLAVFFSRRWRNVIDTSMTKQQYWCHWQICRRII